MLRLLNKQLKRSMRFLLSPKSHRPRRLLHQLRIERLETRLALAFDLSIGLGPTANVAHDGGGNFVAVASGALISVADIRADLLAGKDVTISNGATGTELGSITWQVDNPLDYNSCGTMRQLTITADPTTQPAAQLVLNSGVLDSNPATLDALSLNINAWHDLVVNAPLLPNTGTIGLRADSAQSGSGTLRLTSLATITSTNSGPSSVTLVGADLDLQAGSNININVSTTFATGLVHPGYEAFDTDGNLYVSNIYGNSISKITPDGVVTTFAASGMSNPEGLAFDAAGDLFVANFGNNTISRITPAGVVSTFVSSGLTYPSGLAFDDQGNLFVSNYGGNSISKITPAGVVTPFVTSGLSNPTGLAFDALGNLYVSNFGDDTVAKVSPQGTVTTFFSAFGLLDPTGLAFDSSGNLYIADQGIRGKGYYSVFKVDPAGIGNVFVVHGLVSDPQGLAFDTQGNLYVASANENRIVKVSVEGGTVAVLSSITARPMSLGGTDTAVAGINLTDAELGRLVTAPNGSLLFGDSSQTGDITFTTAILTGPSITVAATQSTASSGKIVLDNYAEGTNYGTPAIYRYGGNIVLTAGTGGIVRFSANIPSWPDIGIYGVGGLAAVTNGSAGSLAAPLRTQMNQLGPSTVAGDFILANDGSLATAGEVNVAGMLDITLNSGHFSTSAGALNTDTTTLTFRGGPETQQLTTGGQVITNVIHQGAGSLVMRDNLTLSGDFTNQNGAGSVDIAGRTIHVGGDWSWGASGMLVSSLSTVILDGTNQTILGNNEFNNLTKTTTVDDTLTLQAGVLQRVNGVLTLQGAPGHLLALRSTVPGTQALINPLGYRAVSYVDVQDNFNTNALVLTAPNSIDSGNTTNWNLVGAPAKMLALAGISQSAIVGANYGALSVLVTDSVGKPVSGVSVTFTITPGGGGAAGTFIGAATAVTNVNGMAFSPTLTANTKAGMFTAHAAIGDGVAPVLFALTNLPGAAANLAILGGSPQSAPVGATYATRFQVLVTDAFGNPVPNATVVFSAPARGASGSFNARPTVASDGLGIATAPAFKANRVRGHYYVTATIAGLPAVSFDLTNTYLPRRRR